MKFSEVLQRIQPHKGYKLYRVNGNPNRFYYAAPVPPVPTSVIHLDGSLGAISLFETNESGEAFRAPMQISWVDLKKSDWTIEEMDEHPELKRYQSQELRKRT